LAKKKQKMKATPNASSALISRERSSIRCSIKGALLASISSALMTLWHPAFPAEPPAWVQAPGFQ